MPTIDERIRSHLEMLPEPALPDVLRQRMQQSLRRRRRRLHLAVAGVAAVLVVIATIPLLPLPQERTSSPVVVHAPSGEPGTAQMRRLHALDRALQAAYDRGASDAEIAPLWQARRALTAGIAPSLPSVPARNHS